jgi:hypothetical protein
MLRADAGLTLWWSRMLRFRVLSPAGRKSQNGNEIDLSLQGAVCCSRQIWPACGDAPASSCRSTIALPFVAVSAIDAFQRARLQVPFIDSTWSGAVPMLGRREGIVVGVEMALLTGHFSAHRTPPRSRSGGYPSFHPVSINGQLQLCPSCGRPNRRSE